MGTKENKKVELSEEQNDRMARNLGLQSSGGDQYDDSERVELESGGVLSINDESGHFTDDDMFEVAIRKESGEFVLPSDMGVDGMDHLFEGSDGLRDTVGPAKRLSQSQVDKLKSELPTVE